MGETLYEITERQEAMEADILRSMEEGTGEIDEEMAAKLWQLEDLKRSKLLGWGRWFKRVEGEASILRAEAKVHADEAAKIMVRAKQKDHLAGWIKRTLGDHMPEGEKLQDENTTLSWRKSEKVKLLAAVPKKFQKQTWQPVLADIMLHLKGLRAVKRKHPKWAEIEERQNLQIK